MATVTGTGAGETGTERTGRFALEEEERRRRGRRSNGDDSSQSLRPALLPLFANRTASHSPEDVVRNAKGRINEGGGGL